jgi:membrane protein implicated in regulation of membrane protease activity
MVRLTLTDALAVVGFFALFTGLWLVSPALALVVAGVLLMAAAVLAHYGGAPLRRSRRSPHVARPHPAGPPAPGVSPS